MTELDNEVVSQLNKKIDDQARFTRIVTVLCCLSIIGCMFYALSAMITTVPDLIVARVMSNVENIHTEWQAIDRLAQNRIVKHATE